MTSARSATLAEPDRHQRPAGSSSRRRARGAAPWWAAVGVLTATAADVAFDPVHTHVPLCPFRALTGWWCPLCGGLRAADALAHGRVITAWQDNAVFLLALPLLAAYWIDWLHRSRAGLRAHPLGRTVVTALVAVLAVFTVVRNLPGLDALRP
jgi:hypothetical protein